MSIAAGIALIVFGAILTFALKGGHIGDLDLHAVGVILMLAGTIDPATRADSQQVTLFPADYPQPARCHGRRDADHREPHRRIAGPRGA